MKATAENCKYNIMSPCDRKPGYTDTDVQE